jgi:hypothetical protein
MGFIAGAAPWIPKQTLLSCWHRTRGRSDIPPHPLETVCCASSFPGFPLNFIFHYHVKLAVRK